MVATMYGALGAASAFVVFVPLATNALSLNRVLTATDVHPG